MEHEKFRYPSLAALREALATLGLSLPLSENLDILKTPASFGGHTAPNRLAVQPMEGCDSAVGGSADRSDGSPDELTIRRYDRFAAGGAGLIWVEAVAVVPEGRANPRQLWLREENLDHFSRLTERIRAVSMEKFGFAPLLIMQATHSGRYSKPQGVPAPLIAYNSPVFEKDRPIDPSRILSDEALDALPERYARSANLARAAGFDGVDIKACHRYLICETLSAFTRPGRYGGSFENRTRLFLDAVRAAKAAVPSDFLITSRLNLYDGFPYPYGFGVNGTDGLTPDLAEPLRLVEILHRELGMPLLDCTIGNPYVNPHVNRPYDTGGYVPPEHPLEGVARMFDCVGQVKKRFPDLTVMSSGHSYLRALSPYLAAGAVEQGFADLAGFGRMAFAYPDFAADILQKGGLDKNRVCLTCGKCSELMRAGSTAGCVLRDGVYTDIYRRDVLKK